MTRVDQPIPLPEGLNAVMLGTSLVDLDGISVLDDTEDVLLAAAQYSAQRTNSAVAAQGTLTLLFALVSLGLVLGR